MINLIDNDFVKGFFFCVCVFFLFAHIVSVWYIYVITKYFKGDKMTKLRYKDLTEREQELFWTEFYMHSSVDEESDQMCSAPWACPWDCGNKNDFLLSEDIVEAAKLYALECEDEILKLLAIDQA